MTGTQSANEVSKMPVKFQLTHYHLVAPYDANIILGNDFLSDNTNTIPNLMYF